MSAPAEAPMAVAPPAHRYARPGILDVALAAAVWAVQIVYQTMYFRWGEDLFLTIAMSVAVLFARPGPAIALGVTWVTGFIQISEVWSLDPQPSQVGIIWVAYAIARHSGQRTLIISGVSALAGTVFGVWYLFDSIASDPHWYVGFYGSLRRLHQRATDLAGPVGLFTSVLFITAPLILPWLIGLVLRLAARYRTSEQARAAAVQEKDVADELRERAQHERESAMRTAAVEAHQARLARDVHDVVGHSLAVILAQAQAGQLVEGEEAMRETLGNIATSARRSLTEVRQVLGELRDGTPQELPVDGLAALVDSLRVAGVEVHESAVGPARALPPEIETVIYRVMQEMVTNVLKHGRPGGAVSIDYLWQDGLRIQVRNYLADDYLDDDTGEVPSDGRGSGITGMRTRLASVGGTLETLRFDTDEGPIMSVTAWVPSGAGR